MNKQAVIDFFDRLAPNWDAEMIRSDTVIGKILDNAGVEEGSRILDVACGTGVLIPDYLERGAASVTGIDISPNMARIAAAKFRDPRVTILCGDAEEASFPHPFDCIVIYNALPHFPDPDRLIAKLAGDLKRGGCLTVAHGMSREKIEGHHRNVSSEVSMHLPSAEDLAKVFSRYLTVTTVVSDDTMYQVVGKKE